MTDSKGKDGQVSTGAEIEPMAEILLYRKTLIPGPLTNRQKVFGQALYRFIASRNDVLLLPRMTKKRGKWTGLLL